MNQSTSPSADISVAVTCVFIGELRTGTIVDCVRVLTLVINGRSLFRLHQLMISFQNEVGIDVEGDQESPSPRRPTDTPSNNLSSMESERSTEISDCRLPYISADMTIGPHIVCSNILVLLRTEHIHLLESEIVARDEQLQMQAISLDAPLQHERDLATQDPENHKSIFAPSDVCLAADL
ncbi:uncharacterized protein ARMOST_11429 [Armillaria ostoyae]|uniref:Uncharacterized protein n=1 Tax=Armillaria ostoyae TaxID=47428 RepID=A0A284RH41_ARMOS|nr:uncharacterized protein ARMOST_11429 [Armillaria ostoyae]